MAVCKIGDECAIMDVRVSDDTEPDKTETQPERRVVTQPATFDCSNLCLVALVSGCGNDEHWRLYELSIDLSVWQGPTCHSSTSTAHSCIF